MYKKIVLISCFIVFNVDAAQKSHPIHTTPWWVYSKKVENVSKYWCCCLWPFIRKKRQKLKTDASARQIIAFANPMYYDPPFGKNERNNYFNTHPEYLDLQEST
jgi:hypothetical protein